MADLRARADEVVDAFASHATAVSRSSAFVKIVLVVGGTATVAVAQCTTLPAAGAWPLWSIIGLIGTALAFLGGIFMALTEPSAALALKTAQRALEDAREAEADSADLGFYFGEIRRATALYGATMLMRTAVENFLASPKVPIETIASTLLEVGDQPLKVALDFQVAYHWTLAVYRIDTELDGTRLLRCCAHMRSLRCELSDARTWPEGRGAGWIALANGTAIVIPDLKSPAMGTLFSGVLSEQDFDRYRSVAAVPIVMPGKQEKWGAVVATSDQEEHFSLSDRPGVRPLEGVKVVADMITLALVAQAHASTAS